MSEKMELAEAGMRHADGLTAQLARLDWRPSRAHIEQARNSIKKLSAALRASPAEGEAIAWTNEAQLGFLKEPGYRVAPMAMWAFQHSAHPVALYTAPPRAAVSPPQREEVAQTIRDHVFILDGDDYVQGISNAADAILALYPAGDGREADFLSGEKGKPE